MKKQLEEALQEVRSIKANFKCSVRKATTVCLCNTKGHIAYIFFFKEKDQQQTCFYVIVETLSCILLTLYSYIKAICSICGFYMV